jgi:hypothetical protein
MLWRGEGSVIIRRPGAKKDAANEKRFFSERRLDPSLGTDFVRAPDPTLVVPGFVFGVSPLL